MDDGRSSGGAGSPPPGRGTGLDEVDRARVRASVASIRALTLDGLLTELFAGVQDGAELAAAVGRHCVLDHQALLVFPEDIDAAPGALAELGAVPGPVVPDPVVRSRLAERLRVPADTLDLRVTRALLPEQPHGRPALTLFLLRRAPDLPAGLVDRERARELERHVALRVVEPDPVVLQGLRWLLHDQAGFGWDGGGHNPLLEADRGGTSTLYFLGFPSDPAGGPPLRRRVTLTFHGEAPAVTRAHLEATRDDQAIAAAAVAGARAAWRQPGPASDERAVAEKGPAPFGEVAPRLRAAVARRLRPAAAGDR